MPSPDRSAPGSSGESLSRTGFVFVNSPVLAGPSMVCGPGSPSRRLSMGDSSQAGSLSLRRGGSFFSPPSGVVETVGVAPEGAQLIASHLSTEVVETVLHPRAPSTRKLSLKWIMFTSWCGNRQLLPVNCPVG